MPEVALDLNAGALAPVADEVSLTAFEVEGVIPPELSGVLARNGPNPFNGRFAGEGMLHWWVAPSMLHGIRFGGGQALWYKNRWVKSGHWDRHHEPATPADPVRDQNTNVNIIDVNQRIMEQFFVMTMAVDVTETTVDMDSLKKRLDRIAKTMALNITLQDEHIFEAMHRI